MKQLLLTLCSLLLLIQIAAAQKPLPRQQPDCPTTVSDTGYYLKDAEGFLARRLAERAKDPTPLFSLPYTVRVFIRIVRNTDGTLPGCTVDTALNNFREMQGQYNGHNICFQLAGIDFINDTYLNNFNIRDSLNSVYPAYIRANNYDVDGAITVFIHYNFLNNSGSSGNAYGIPNNFMSIARWAINDPDVRSIMGHEMGHCLGLYHTFERYNGSQEAVTRNSGNSCYNCIVEGDLCCDTPADYEDSDTYTSSTCTYSRNFTNNCDGLQYSPSTSNIMSYHPWTCISTTSTALTPNQRTRMHAAINDPVGPIYSRVVAEDDLVLNSLSRSSFAVRLYTARNTVTTAGGAIVTHSGQSNAYYAAPNGISFGPGVTFAPGSGGVVSAVISKCN